MSDDELPEELPEVSEDAISSFLRGYGEGRLLQPLSLAATQAAAVEARNVSADWHNSSTTFASNTQSLRSSGDDFSTLVCDVAPHEELFADEAAPPILAYDSLLCSSPAPCRTPDCAPIAPPIELPGDQQQIRNVRAALCSRFHRD